ncbi:MAG: hypothetical protein ACTSUE_24190 [Promethearchaeota archaeon]
MSYSKNEIKEICEKPIVLKPGAYQKMLMHVLRFGSPGIPKDQWRECYGMCVGKFSKSKDKIITITDVLPTTHGSDIGVEFVEENYILMAQFMDQLDRLNADIEDPDEKLFIVGWYHSHPGMERFLSSVDVRNQIAYQQAGFPFGVAIVFDNTCVFQKDPSTGKLDLGFKIFRLDEPTSTEVNIPFSEVEFDRELLEQPALIECWKNEMQMVDNIQKRLPFIKEYSETPSVFGMFKIPTTEELRGAGTGITSEDRQEISILPLAELDQVFTRGLQFFIEKYESYPPGDKTNFEKFLDDGMYPMMKKMLDVLVGGLNSWTKKLRVDLDKRVNFGISALNSIKTTMASTQEEYVAFLKALAEKSQNGNKELAGQMNTLEATIRKSLKQFKGDLKLLFGTMETSIKNLIDKAGEAFGESELQKISKTLDGIKAVLGKGSPEGSTGSTGIASAANAGEGTTQLQELMSRHLEMVNQVYEHLNSLKAEERAPDVLGNFSIPTTAEISDMSSFIGEIDDVTEDLIKIGEIPDAFKSGLKEFIQFYHGLGEEQKKDFPMINEKGIQPFSDKVVSNLVRGINQWTVQLRDDVDKRVNLLVSLVNEMQRTMKNIQDDFVEFMAVSTDPSSRLRLSIQKIMGDVETNALSVFNNILAYLEQVLQNVAYVFQSNLEKQNSLLEQKELKKISKTLEQLSKSVK